MATLTSPSSLSAPINIQADDDNGGLRDVEWIPDLSTPTQQGFYGNRDQKVIFYRDKTQSADSMGNYWVAWEVGKSVEQMKRVEWKKIDPTGTMGWLRVNTDGSIYFENGKAKHWLPNTLNLWGDI